MDHPDNYSQPPLDLWGEIRAAVDKMSAWKRRCLAFVLALSAAVGFSWISDGSAELLRQSNTEGSVRLLLVGLAVFTGASIGLYSLRRRLFGTRVIHASVVTINDARPCMIIFISRERKPRTLENQSTAWENRLTWSIADQCYQVNGNQGPVKLTGDISADIDRLNSLKEREQWPWQQVLRAVEPHLDRLERIWLLGSPEDEGSARDLDLCGAWLHSYRKIPKDIRTSAKDKLYTVDFENYEALELKLREIIRLEHVASGKQDDRRIVIDITGGQKTTSVAAAQVTLNSDVVFQYVQTNEPKKPIIYDITYDNPLFQEE